MYVHLLDVEEENLMEEKLQGFLAWFTPAVLGAVLIEIIRRFIPAAQRQLLASEMIDNITKASNQAILSMQEAMSEMKAELKKEKIKRIRLEKKFNSEVKKRADCQKLVNLLAKKSGIKKIGR